MYEWYTSINCIARHGPNHHTTLFYTKMLPFSIPILNSKSFYTLNGDARSPVHQKQSNVGCNFLPLELRGSVVNWCWWINPFVVLIDIDTLTPWKLQIVKMMVKWVILKLWIPNEWWHKTTMLMLNDNEIENESKFNALTKQC